MAQVTHDQQKTHATTLTVHIETNTADCELI